MSQVQSDVRRLLAASAIAVVLSAMGGLAQAQDAAVATAQADVAPPSDPREARIAALEAQVQALAEQIADLKSSEASNVKAIRDDQAAAPKVAISNARPTITSGDGAFKFAVRTVVQFDAAKYDVSPLRADNDLGSGVNFRRARLGVDGTAYKDWNFAIWGEFGGSGGESTILNQAYVEYAGLHPYGANLRLRAGAWATPAGLEDATSNTEELFLERAAGVELVRGLGAGDGRTGAGAFLSGEHWYASGVVTGKVVGVPAVAEFDQQGAVIGRIAIDPLHGLDFDTHLGANFQHIFKVADNTAGPLITSSLRLRERPELRVDGNRLVDTGAMTADGLDAYGLEAGASYRNVYVAAEWNRIDVNRTSAGSPFDPSFTAWYVQGAWTLTGERHAWSVANGGFKGITPAKPFSLKGSGYGAWELAARYSVLDLNDGAGGAGAATPAGGIRGGEQTITTVGINWYPNPVLRFLLDYQWVKIDRLSALGANVGEDVNTLSFRSQFAF